MQTQRKKGEKRLFAKAANAVNGSMIQMSQCIVTAENHHSEKWWPAKTHFAKENGSTWIVWTRKNCPRSGFVANAGRLNSKMGSEKTDNTHITSEMIDFIVDNCQYMSTINKLIFD